MSRILVVDDEDILRDAICEALQRNGHDVVGSPDGDEALDKVVD